jgi:glycerol-1-phosphate dehydrogenase [NAD(P)+]
MTKPDIHIHTSDDAVPALVTYCQNLPQDTFTLVADDNTYAALGERVAGAMQSAGLNVQTIVLSGDEVIADEEYIMQVLLNAPHGEQVFLAVGSGTITDIVRFASHRLDNRFISVPTAPSVDGFISLGAALVIRGLKDTYYVDAPLAVFGDLTTLANAPTELIAAGYGDIIGKFTSLADWHLAHLIWGEPFDEAVEQRVRRALDKCVAATEPIAARSPEGIKSLIEALLESGIGMFEFGNSRPASGSEHHCSHYWEMKLLEDHKPAILHGAKVGYSTSLIAQQYAALRDVQRSDLMDLLEGAELPPREDVMQEIHDVYGDAADEVIAMQRPYLDLSPTDYDAVKHRIAEHWDDIQTALATVPTPDEVRHLIQTVGGPTDWQTLGLEQHRVQEALLYGHHLRTRFTVFKLQRLLGLSPITPFDK